MNRPARLHGDNRRRWLPWRRGSRLPALPAWPALLLAPCVVLLQQSVGYAAVPPACGFGSVIALHATSAVALLATLSMTVLAAGAWWQTRHAVDNDHRADNADRTLARRHFIAALGLAVGTLSVLAAAMLWMPVWVLSPCVT